MNIRRKRVRPAGEGWDSPYAQDIILRCVVSRAQSLCICSLEDAQGWVRDACNLFLPSGNPPLQARVETALALGLKKSKEAPVLQVTRVVVFRGICLYTDILPGRCLLDEALFVAIEHLGAELVLHQINVSQNLVDLVARCCPSLKTLRLFGTSRTCTDQASHLISGNLVEGGCTKCAFRGGERLLGAVCQNAWASLCELDVRDHGLRTVYEGQLHNLRWDRPRPVCDILHAHLTLANAGGTRRLIYDSRTTSRHLVSSAFCPTRISALVVWRCVILPAACPFHVTDLMLGLQELYMSVDLPCTLCARMLTPSFPPTLQRLTLCIDMERVSAPALLFPQRPQLTKGLYRHLSDVPGTASSGCLGTCTQLWIHSPSLGWVRVPR